MNNINRLIALWMGEEYTGQDFSLPDHFARMTERLFENTLLYERFEYYAGTAWANSGTHQYMIQWLFQPDDQLRYTRFITLFAEFLRLDETVREFGWERCHYKNSKDCKYCDPEGILPLNISCDECDGKVLSAWAREEEGKDG